MIVPLASLLSPVAARLLDFGGEDFASPAGEPAMLGPDSLSWRVFGNPVTLYIGGVAAVLLEFGEPRVRTGVWEHSSFRTEPAERMRRTGAAAMLTVYGARSRFEAMARRVNALHDGISGRTPSGQSYRASDPELLNWVQATASFAFLSAYDRFAEPLLQAERDAYYREAALVAPLYRVQDPPRSEAELEALFDRMEPLLEPSGTMRDFLRIMRRGPILPLPLRPLQPLVVRAAVEILPERLRPGLGLDREPRLNRWQSGLVRTLAQIAGQMDLPDSPWSQACRRIGLPGDCLRRPSPGAGGRPRS